MRIMTPSEQFEKNGYLVMSNVVSQEDCEELTNNLLFLENEGMMVRDLQCPMSGSMYGYPLLDSLLEMLADPLSEVVGRKLIPSYSYARVYKNGEVLEIHRDRESCELSATLTLGYDSNKIWPIYFSSKENGEDKVSIDLEVGELAFYKGTELFHWRDKFEGNWQTQVFLHYVDAHGLFAESHKYDGREKLNHQ